MKNVKRYLKEHAKDDKNPPIRGEAKSSSGLVLIVLFLLLSPVSGVVLLVVLTCTQSAARVNLSLSWCCSDATAPYCSELFMFFPGS